MIFLLRSLFVKRLGTLKEVTDPRCIGNYFDCSSIVNCVDFHSSCVKSKSSEACKDNSDDHNLGNKHSSTTSRMKVLNVAEKNDAAKRIAGLLSRGTARTVRKF